jgi:DeoR family transcriptional regulator of aga operon
MSTLVIPLVFFFFRSQHHFWLYGAIVGIARLRMEKENSSSSESQRTIHREPELTVSAVEAPLDGMMAEERRTQIMQIVRTAGRVKVNELASRFSTSAVTIRNDLNELHQRGMVLRSHGGAVLPDTILRESPVHERLNANSDEKRRIGARAAMLINDGETIILDSGTTTLEIARQIKRKQGLHIITNGVNIAAELLDARDVQTFIIGGTVRGESASVSGRFSEEMFDQFSADKLFLSGAGCDLEFGVSGANLEETMVNRAMMRIAREIILVADASKFSKRSMTRIAPFAEIDTVISDTKLSEEIQERLRLLGCNLILA